MKELDLYADLPPPAQTPSSDPASLSPRAASLDWLEELWRAFPPGIRERYQPVRVLGEGGMGIVLEVEDRLLSRRVAVKGPRDPRAVSASARDRLAHEARLHARLTHPNILPVFDAWTDARGLPWCAMLRVDAPEGAEAQTLASLIAGLPPVFEARPIARLLETFVQVCRAMVHAHSAGILHRDLKPANILLGPTGEALVADWGVAYRIDPDATRVREVVGTPGYAAPEQLAAVPPDPRGDVFSLGVILRELAGSKCPRELAAVADRAAHADPGRRFASVALLQAAVEAYLTGGLVEGLDYTARERLVRWARRRPGQAAVAAAAVLFVIAGALAGWSLRAQVRRAQENLALANAGWAAAEESAGRHEEAQMYAAMAYVREQEEGGDWALPEGRVHRIFACTGAPGPLVWAASLGSPVQGLRFSGDRLIALTKKARLVQVDLTGRQPVSEQELGPGVRASASTPDAGWFVTPDTQDTARLWRREGARWREAGTVPAAHGTAAFAPDGSLLAIVRADGTALLVNPATRETVGALPANGAPAWIIRFSPDGKLIATCSDDGKITLYDVAARAVRWWKPAPVLISMRFTPDGSTVAAVGSDDRVRTWAVTDGAAGAIGKIPKGATALAFSPDGRLLAVGGADFHVYLWDRAGHVLARLGGHTDGVWGVEFSPDGRLLATGSEDGSARLWSVGAALAAEELEQANANKPVVTGIAPDGRAALYTAPGGAVVRVDRATGRVTARHASPFEPQSLALTNGGTAIAAALDGEVARWCDLARPQSVSRHDAPGMTRVMLAPDASSLLLGGTRVQRVTLSGGLVRDWPAPTGGATALAFAADRRFAAGGADGSVHVYSEHDAPVRHALFQLPVSAVTLDATGAWLAAGTTAGDVTVLRLATGERLPGVWKMGPVDVLALAPGATSVAAGGPDSMHCWTLPSGYDEPRLQVIDMPVWGLGFTPGGDALFATHGVRPVIWELAAIARPADRIRAIVDASFIATPDGMAKIRPKELADAPPVRPY